ncbi:DUF4174 domain-containing protein [Oryzifoliimicrobium ureilyticus]|uniref:DUF4174 domain-containing protein n=1 Tax=Oryzifoliimicrobium ureilyticus TaxID=3113724 RepID=UPI0030764FDE
MTFWIMGSAPSSAMDSLGAYTWKNRVLIIAGRVDDEKLRRQIVLLQSHGTDLAERDLVVLQIGRDELRTLYGDKRRTNPKAVRQEANITGEAFQLILIGKDGGVKLRRDQPVSADEIFSIIDVMPMRRAEKTKSDAE